jgi:superoxide dismutase, Fe-Mn family
MSDASRREFLQGALALAAAGVSGLAMPVAAETPRGRAIYDAVIQLVPRPLPFEAMHLKGLSALMLRSHWDGSYLGAVTGLNAVTRSLAQARAEGALPRDLYQGLQREQAIRANSVVLHECYFENLGGSAGPAATVRQRIARSFGTFDAWESEFRTIGTDPDPRLGWVVLGFNERLQRLENIWLADASPLAPGITPILAMDLYEHAYLRDFGTAAARYVDAFIANVNWEVVARRLG